VISNFFVEPFLEDIEPRPLEAEILPRPINESIPTPITSPEPPQPPAVPAQEIAAHAITVQQIAPVIPELNEEVRGKNESDVLLAAIRIVARKEESFVTQCALRDLIRRFAHQFSLDF
jgi:hypothetical protein